MAKYRTSPVIIEAIQLDSPLFINTSEGVMHGNVGDWLITGVHDEMYICKNVRFQELYELVEEVT